MLWEVDLGQRSLGPVTFITGLSALVCDGCSRLLCDPHYAERVELLSCRHADGAAAFPWELESETC